jgi:hypothetical protein
MTSIWDSWGISLLKNDNYQRAKFVFFSYSIFLVMIFFLYSLHFFPFIRGDCLEFANDQITNECLIKEIENHDFDIERYYPQCLRCTIETLITPENIKFEEDNQCLSIELQCIQLIFNNKETFEDFFRFHQQFIYDLFNKDNGTDQNTLHVIIKDNTLEEINSDYIETIFQFKYQGYRALFFEIHYQNQNIIINRNLINITRLSMKLILVCSNDSKPKQTIYAIHNRKITLENEQNSCPSVLIPSITATSSTLIIHSTSDVLSSISQEKSKDIVLVIILLTGSLVLLLTMLIIYCFKRLKHHHMRLSKKSDTTSELSTSQDISIETPLSNEKPKLSLKPKRPLRGMRAIQLLEDDI